MKKLLLAIVASAALALPSQAAAPYYIAGDFNGWNSAGNLMTETFSGSGIWQVGLNMGTGRHEFKVTDGTWGWNVPGSGNSWLTTDGSGNVTITYDANTYSDGWSPASGRIGVNVDPGTWTAAGDWQGWNNANPATAMTSIGGGIYQYSTYLAVGTYQYKAVNTGTWDAIGADSRGINAATASFTVNPGWDLFPTVFSVNALDGSIKVEVVPEPSTFALLGLALAGLVAFRRRS
jgi:hypothetical protein